MTESFSNIISQRLGIEEKNVQSTLALFAEGATIPFIARYRKERTGNLDEVQIKDIRDLSIQLEQLWKRKAAVTESIRQQGLLTPELEKSILEAETMAELEDIYLPYKPKRKTRASIAREKGLEPLAKMLMSQGYFDVEARAATFINAAKGVADVQEALDGARDIIAEWISENRRARAMLRDLFHRKGTVNSRVAKDKEEEGKVYANYFSHTELVKNIPSHRTLAILRGENEGFLKVSVEPPSEDAIQILEGLFIRSDSDASLQVGMAARDSYKRLLQPSLETEVRNAIKERADRKAIEVFTGNLRQLLMAPPLGRKNVLAIDPGFNSGCKVVCLDRQGRVLHNETIYPHPPQKEFKKAIGKIQQLVNAYKIEAIAVGNGTAGRETEQFIRKVPFDRELMAVMVNESGASVYSASAVAREELPQYDVTVRGAASIGRRLMDPLAELVKIDPKSIGVGQYQHDVDQGLLQQSLEDEVVSCVNAVGVEVNTASKQLLSYVSGIGPSLAANIIEHRDKNGPFGSRSEFLKVSRFGAKAFELAAGFLRIRDAANPLDQSAVHPESYHIVERMAQELGCSIENIIGDDALRSGINPEHYITDKAGLPTIRDIIEELAKPGRDPRKKFAVFEFDKTVQNINDLREGMVLPGIVTNITAFGAFVDIGVHQDGLVHISQISDHFIKDPAEVVKLNQKVSVRVLSVDVGMKRIQLSMKHLLVLILFLLSASVASYAQVIRGAAIVGFNATQVDGDEVFGYHKFGANVGAAAIIPFNEKWSVSLETLFNQKGSYQKPVYVDSLSGEYKLILNYAEVPVLVHFTDRKTITVGGGFSWGRLVEVKEWEHGIRVESTTLDGPYDRNDFNILADLRFRMFDRFHFNFRYAYSLDMIRTREFPKINQTRNQYNNVLSFRVIYIFREDISDARRNKSQNK